MTQKSYITTTQTLYVVCFDKIKALNSGLAKKIMATTKSVIAFRVGTTVEIGTNLEKIITHKPSNRVIEKY